MCVSVSEIDFVISIESFINSDDDRDKFLKLVKYNYGSLLNTSVFEDIKSLTKDDLIKICVYNPITDTFSGLEYYMLRHFMDSDIDGCIRDQTYTNLLSKNQNDTKNYIIILVNLVSFTEIIISLRASF